MIDWLEEILGRDGEPEEAVLSPLYLTGRGRTSPLWGPALTRGEPAAFAEGRAEAPAVMAETVPDVLRLALDREEGGPPAEGGAETVPGALDEGVRRGTLAVERLYRRTEGAASTILRPGPPRAGTIMVEEEAAARGGLTVAELDRAVRRDSRRYDGGLSIY